jgi:hypothetical protein
MDLCSCTLWHLLSIALHGRGMAAAHMLALLIFLIQNDEVNPFSGRCMPGMVCGFPRGMSGLYLSLSGFVLGRYPEQDDKKAEALLENRPWGADVLQAYMDKQLGPE